MEYHKILEPPISDVGGAIVGAQISLLLTRRSATRRNVLASYLSAFALVIWVIPGLQEYYQLSVRATSTISMLGGMCAMPIFSGLYQVLPEKFLSSISNKELIK